MAPDRDRLVRPLALAIALASGIALAPALDRAGVSGSLRWLVAAAAALATVATALTRRASTAEPSRTTAESSRTTAEPSRTTAESSRTTAESSRATKAAEAMSPDGALRATWPLRALWPLRAIRPLRAIWPLRAFWPLRALWPHHARRPWHHAWLIAAVLAAGAARGARSPAEVPDGATVDDRTPDRITGELVGPVIETARGRGALLDTSGAGVWLWTDERIEPGERIAATGLLRTARGARGPGMPDRRDALLVRGAAFELTADQIERLSDEPGLAARIWRWAARTQARGSRAIDEAGGDPAARAALCGIAIGDRTDVPDALDARWRASGIYHVLSVSGLHLAVVAALAFAVLRRLVAASPWGGRTRPARWAAPPALAIAVAYTLVTGAQLATLRALIAIALVLIAAMLERPLRLIDAIGAAALVLLAARPADLLDPGFQLSFTAAITLAVRPATEPAGGRVRDRVLHWIRRGIASSLWIAITTPIVPFAA